MSDYGESCSVSSVSTREYHPTTETGHIVAEFDHLQKTNDALIEGTIKAEKKFYTLCQKFLAEKTEWKNEQVRLNNVEHENSRLNKDLGNVTKQFARVKEISEREAEKNRQLTRRIEELESIIESMREVVFNDTSDDGMARQAAINELQSSVLNSSRQISQCSDELNESTDKSVTAASDVESDLNVPYGEYFTGSRTLLRQSREFQRRDFPIPSGNSISFSPQKPLRPPQPVMLQSPLKSSLKQSPSKYAKKCTFGNESFLNELDGAVYNTPTKTTTKLIKASEAIPTELVIYISALQNKLSHPNLYIKTPETDDLGKINAIKRTLQNCDYDGNVILEELDNESTTVLCQLVKDFFLDKDPILVGGSDLCEDMLQAVRSCNDQYLMTLFRSMPSKDQMQLAFLLLHLQNAVDAGRLAGELACSFGGVVVGPGARNKNDPKELIQKMIELPESFYRNVLSPNSNEPAKPTSATQLKNLIKQKQKKLLQKFDGKIFQPPQL